MANPLSGRARPHAIAAKQNPGTAIAAPEFAVVQSDES